MKLIPNKRLPDLGLLLLLSAGCARGAAPASAAIPTPNLDAPPAPRAANVPRPNAAVTAPNLRVLPWAGFRAAVTFTFDDSQPSQTAHLAELQATRVRMTFFLNPSQNWQSGYDAVWSAAAAAGSELGNHTWSHCRADLTGCSFGAGLGTQAEEIARVTDYLVSNLGAKAVYSFASPFGDSGWNQYAAPEFLLGRGVRPGSVSPAATFDWYNLPVFAAQAGMTATDFDGAIDDARAGGVWTIFLFHSILPTSANWYAGVEIADITAAAGYGTAFGDVWMDTMVNIGAYARAQQMFESLAPADNIWTWTLPAHFPPGKALRVTVDGGTLSQNGAPLAWNPHGYYQVALDAGTLTWKP